ncbi:hypothetical protein [Actinomadura harenae]|uniref:Uncharacterized protein n=1 Tax=Actinomadura harenae TaxID=2483351 RepID=A0A3M2LGT6_9ACTN|nr:hypothetical protein [Actinomadura harenae]RMI36709.1 hypothetical protein EBO15_37945 [Actinomadura harenae]
MSPHPFQLDAAPWLVLLVIAWPLTVVITCVLRCRIARAAINKSDVRDLPQVLTALGPLLRDTFTPVPGLPAPPPLALRAETAAPEAAMNLQKAPATVETTQ